MSNSRFDMKRLFYLLVLLMAPAQMFAQMLFSENLTMSLDSTKTLQGTIMPVLNFQNEKENVFTLKNTANINLLIKRSRVINLINKLEFSTYGDKVTVSGGYVHLEYRYLLHRAFELYPYAESQWAESRGMTFKISTGLQSRYRLVNSSRSLMFATLGLFFEHEEWKYPDSSPLVGKYAHSNKVKSHFSLSFRHQLGEHWELTTTAIHQGSPDSYFKAARFGGAADLKLHITPSIGLRGTYRLIYDTAPIVPIRKDYNVVEAGIDLSF